ncbi:NAD(P)-dependent oxidoreductase [Achromobacter aloeverae]|uniref:3-hydroxyisobutyrate dehydrogenase n=1 Tax=Achromobacter aloeverae TaxID=1750518 RepID=A0A4Q1HM62_9BURK|nr:NAD(P)-dependent oxidoreductase [Achromobacter aloeverae]RXN91581.1 3-hydroxyisobutyrate dehydrogenase [Achromobacter aloeverae]
MAKQLGFVGIGQMGGAMAAHLTRSGFSVTGYDPSEQSRALAAKDGVKVVTQLRDAVLGADVVLTSLPNPAIALEAWLGQEGILDYMAEGSTGMELSSIDPEVMRQIAAAAAKRGVRMVDAPVSGGPLEAAAGQLVLMTGGEERDIEAVGDILDSLSSSRHMTGPVGTGKTVKLVNNMMSMGNIVVAAEAFALGTAAGVDPRTLFNVLSQSGGRSHHFLKRFPKAIEGDYAPGFKIELGEKDVALGIELGRKLMQPTPAASLVREMIALGMAGGRKGQDVVAMLDYYLSANSVRAGQASGS